MKTNQVISGSFFNCPGILQGQFFAYHNFLKMHLYDKFFYAIALFLFGVLLASVKISFLFIVVLSAGAAVLFFFLIKLNFIKKKFLPITLLFLFIIAGSFYYLVYSDYQLKKVKIIFNQKIEFSGVVENVREKNPSQKFVVGLKTPYSGKILVKTSAYPEYQYGDLLKFNGIIENLDQKYNSYLAKDNVFGTLDFPKIDLISKNQGLKIYSFLYSIKNNFIGNLKKSLPAEQSAFLSGIILGEREDFSKEFKKQMSVSGTTHLVALSGYNISILVFVISSLLGWFFSRRISFYFSILLIIVFVLMAGAQASVVRAAFMGGILLLANKISRVYSFRNSIATAAFIMVLINPKVLAFDLGFQLSFLALMGIAYLHPAIKNFWKVAKEAGFLSWRENLLTTISAQAMVFPVLISNFGLFSFISIISNILILSLIPLTMSLGFILGMLGFVSGALSLIFGWFVNLFVSYEIFVIKFFGSMEILRINHLSPFFIFAYYLALAVFIVYAHRRPAMVNRSGGKNQSSDQHAWLIPKNLS